MQTALGKALERILDITARMSLQSSVIALLLCNECVYQIISAYLLAFARSIAEVGAVSMVGGAIS